MKWKFIRNAWTIFRKLSIRQTKENLSRIYRVYEIYWMNPMPWWRNVAVNWICTAIQSKFLFYHLTRIVYYISSYSIAKLTSASNYNPINRRQLTKLTSYLANNQAQLQIIHNQIDAQWSSFQDLMRRNSRTQMHTPCLEGVYQRMTKLKDTIARERTKLNYIKSKLKERGLLYNQLKNSSKPEV